METLQRGREEGGGAGGLRAKGGWEGGKGRRGRVWAVLWGRDCGIRGRDLVNVIRGRDRITWGSRDFACGSRPACARAVTCLRRVVTLLCGVVTCFMRCRDLLYAGVVTLSCGVVTCFMRGS